MECESGWCDSHCVSVNVIEGASVSVCDSGCDDECVESQGKGLNRYECECECGWLWMCGCDCVSGCE